MTVSQYGPVSRAPGSQGFPLDVLETKTLMWGGSTRIMEAEGTCMISARRFTNSCHFRMISEGTSIECAALELRYSGDLRARVIEEIATGASRREEDERYGISASVVVIWERRWK